MESSPKELTFYIKAMSGPTYTVKVQKNYTLKWKISIP